MSSIFQRKVTSDTASVKNDAFLGKMNQKSGFAHQPITVFGASDRTDSGIYPSDDETDMDHSFSHQQKVNDGEELVATVRNNAYRGVNDDVLDEKIQHELQKRSMLMDDVSTSQEMIGAAYELLVLLQQHQHQLEQHS
eukprot:m.92570 g.92570  ORF g.92570 m.92570 type:complete len:138 (-) comp8894_c0_seq1:50-463(-)